MENLFVVILTYLAPLEEILRHRPAHVEFLDMHYEKGTFLASGPQVPRTGGVIIAQKTDRASLERLLKDDPFSVLGLAQYSIIEFAPSRREF